MKSLANPLIGTLTSSLGVSHDQAEGGVGSILTLAKEKLAKGDFAKVAAVIPAGLNGALGKLGIDAATSAKFIPAVTSFVGKAGGSKLGKLLTSALL
jgi:hypothetical protein